MLLEWGGLKLQMHKAPVSVSQWILLQTTNILFSLALNRWQETGRDSNSSRHDLRDTGRIGLRNKQANVKVGIGNVLQLFREYKTTKRGELFSFTEQNVNKVNIP